MHSSFNDPCILHCDTLSSADFSFDPSNIASVQNSSTSFSSDISAPVSSNSTTNIEFETNHDTISIDPIPNCDSEISFANQNPTLRKSPRVIKRPKYLEAYDCQLPSHANSVTNHPISQYLSPQQLSHSHKAFTTFLTKIPEPNHYHQAIQYDQWINAMQI